MVNKFEAYGIAISIGLMVLALWITRVQTTTNALAVVQGTDQSAAVHMADGDVTRSTVGNAVLDATNEAGNLEKLIIDDVVIGSGKAVEDGDTVTVNYIGTLQNGQEFDNSYKKGQPFTFEIGKGRVIAGWEEGLLGMKEGGQRILVIPYQKAYGESGFAAIPPKSTLVFAIELVSISR